MTQTKPSHVLELNGKQYDALSGRLIDGRASSGAPKSVDGLVQSAHHSGRPVHGLEAPRFAAHAPAEHKVFDVSRTGAHHTRPHQLQHSKTLMRQAVHRPDASLKRRTKTVPHTGALVKSPSFDVVPKYSVNNLDHERWKRARAIARSRLIRRFADVHPSINQPVARPKSIAAPIQQATPPVRQASTDIFERALATANSHKQPYAPAKHAKKHHRLRTFTGVVASSMAILLIVGFVAYQNAAVIQLRVASSRAGINATLPAWQPSGFRVGTFAYGPGNVTVKYTNPANGSSFVIAQASSDWNSDTLLNDYVYPNNETYDTLSSGGNTIYTYGNNNATWVSGGIWYKLTSNGTLSNSQIVNIATSM